MTWRKNGAKLTRRKAIRDEARRRMWANRNDHEAHRMYLWARDKIRRFYDVVPMSQWWPLPKGRK